jgi:4-hydroxy-tetrahydrodipicolinate reductase
VSAPRLAIVGANGRMGRRLMALAGEAGLPVAAEIDLGTPGLSELVPGSVDCVIDFSAVAQAPRTAAWGAAAGVPCVLGATGLGEAELGALRTAGGRVPVVWAPNFSAGVNAFFDLIVEAAKLLGPGFDVEVLESHHRLKLDAPSGTARRAAELLCEARGLAYDEAVRHGREGQVGARPEGEIGVHAVRGGDVVGEHTVLFLGAGERLELTHRATDRDSFARGALRAARWAASAGRLPGLYGMRDVLRGG